MRYKPKNVAALHLALGGLPDRMRVKADQSTGVSARTVGELRKATTWAENLAITTPLDGHPESVVMVARSSPNEPRQNHRKRKLLTTKGAVRLARSVLMAPFAALIEGARL
jgi:hypothetical protein